MGALPRTRAELIEAGRRHARERGDRLTPAQTTKLAALLRPHLVVDAATDSRDTA